MTMDDNSGYTPILGNLHKSFAQQSFDSEFPSIPSRYCSFSHLPMWQKCHPWREIKMPPLLPQFVKAHSPGFQLLGYWTWPWIDPFIVRWFIDYGWLWWFSITFTREYSRISSSTCLFCLEWCCLSVFFPCESPCGFGATDFHLPAMGLEFRQETFAMGFSANGPNRNRWWLAFRKK